MDQLFISLIEHPADKNISLVENWVKKMQKQGTDAGLIGDRLHNFCGLLDLAFECSMELQPNPFFRITEGLMSLCKKIPRARQLKAYIVPKKKTKGQVRGHT